MLSKQYLEQCAAKGWSWDKIRKDSGASKGQIQYWCMRYQIDTEFMIRRDHNEVLAKDNLKECKCCGRILPKDKFAVDKRSKDGLKPVCREDEAKRIREYRQAKKLNV